MISKRTRLRTERLLTATAIAIMLTGCATTVRDSGTSTRIPWPSPASGPGRPTIDSTPEHAVTRGYSELAEGRTQKARSLALKASGTAQGDLLEHQIGLSQGASNLVPAIQEIADEHPSYAAVWITLSFAAEREQLEATALEAARAGAQLWRTGRWKDRVTELENRWVITRLESASQLLDAGESEQALETVDLALELQPDLREGQLLKARTMIELGRADDAEILLATLGGDTEATWLAGRIAEERNDWLTAMDLYESLPEDFPGLSDALHRARINWRIQHLPPYVQKAMASEELNREELAVLLVALAPDAEMVGSRPIPVLPDIVDLETQREILTAVRTGLIETDPLEPRFDPSRTVNSVQLQASAMRLAELVGTQSPMWCNDSPDMVSSSCISVPEKISGQFVVSLIVDLIRERVQ
ncbi:MAG: hypothetical protein GY906_05895 [bacterium]|nr:hypothetical protein [bacterium]